MQPGPDRRAREGAGLVLEHDLAGGQRAVPLGAELDLDDGARRRAGAAEHLLAAHHHLDRPAGLLRQGQGDGLEIDEGFATEAAADLGRDRADVGDVDAEELGAIGAHHELALARAPDRALLVRRERHDAGMRLDIGLVHRRVRIAPLDRRHRRRGNRSRCRPWRRRPPWRRSRRCVGLGSIPWVKRSSCNNGAPGSSPLRHRSRRAARGTEPRSARSASSAIEGEVAATAATAWPS